MTLHVTVVRKPLGSFDMTPTTYFEVTGPGGLSGGRTGCCAGGSRLYGPLACR